MARSALNKQNSNFVIIFMYWVIFEWPLLSKINNLSIINTIRSAIDLLPLLIMILNILFQKGKMKKYELAIFIVILLILIIGSLSTLIEGYSCLAAIQIIAVSFRYVPFLILIRQSSLKIIKKFYKHIRIIFWVMVVFSVFEIANKALFMRLFLPSPSIFGKALPTIYRSQRIEISTTFINTIDFSFFIILISFFYIVQTEKITEKVIVFITAIVMVFFSFSVASLLCMVLIGIFLFKKCYIFWIISLIILIAGISMNQQIIKLMTGTDSIHSFIQISNKYNRLGFFTILMPEFFKGNPKDILLGMGLDANLVDNKLSSYKNLPLMLTFGDNNIKLLKDVYWVGIILTEGIIVMFLYIRIFYLLYSKSKKLLSADKAQVSRLMIFIVILLGLFNQVLDVKSFSYCFWVMIGIMIKYGYDFRLFSRSRSKYLQTYSDNLGNTVNPV